jgi:hypothetical protein
MRKFNLNSISAIPAISAVEWVFANPHRPDTGTHHVLWIVRRKSLPPER